MTPRLAPEAVQLLAAQSWPGNVRELENLVERAVVLGGAEAISAEVVRQLLDTEGPGAPAFGVPRLVTLRQLESDYIAWVLAACEGNKTRAAEVLGIDVSTLHRRERREDGKTPG